MKKKNTKPGVTVTDKMFTAFNLSIFWSGIWNDYGYLKQNRGSAATQIIDLSVTNQARSSASNAAVATLQGLGRTVLTV
jgi:hypothetical protein